MNDGILANVDPGFLLIAHAVIMVLTWGVMVPVSLVLTRFYKVTPAQNFPQDTDNPFWMRSHRAMSTITVYLSTVGAGLAFWALNGISLASLHGKWGFAVVVLGWVQIFIILQRGTHGGPWGINNPERIVLPRDDWFGDHYNMTMRRRIFEPLHIYSGYATAAAGLVAVVLGMQQFGLGLGWYAAYGAFLAAILLAYWKFTRDGKRVPTYQAIWGYDSEHPGNRPGRPEA